MNPNPLNLGTTDAADVQEELTVTMSGDPSVVEKPLNKAQQLYAMMGNGFIPSMSFKRVREDTRDEYQVKLDQQKEDAAKAAIFWHNDGVEKRKEDRAARRAQRPIREGRRMKKGARNALRKAY